MLNDNGGVIDDLIAYKLENVIDWWLIALLEVKIRNGYQKSNYSVQMEERYLSMVIQGPKSSEVLSIARLLLLEN